MSAWQFSWGLLSCAGEFLLLGTKSAVELHSEGFPPSFTLHLPLVFILAACSADFSSTSIPQARGLAEPQALAQSHCRRRLHLPFPSPGPCSLPDPTSLVLPPKIRGFVGDTQRKGTCSGSSPGPHRVPSAGRSPNL